MNTAPGLASVARVPRRQEETVDTAPGLALVVRVPSSPESPVSSQ